MNDSEVENLIQRACSGDYETHGVPSEADCLIGFSFGFRKVGSEMQPGLSNEDLAQFIQEHFKLFPKILQFEIAVALGDPQPARIERHRTAGAYLNTKEVAEQALEIMKSHAWSKPLLVAHPHHMPRVDAICQKLGMRTIVPPGLGFVRFDPESEQPWTRSEASWVLKEPDSIKRHAAAGTI